MLVPILTAQLTTCMVGRLATSFLISGMPATAILPQTTVELAAYGLFAGLLREKTHWGLMGSLLGAMAGGRLVLLLSAGLVFLAQGTGQSFLGPVANPWLAVWAAIRQGWPGMLLQLSLLPLLVAWLERFTWKCVSQCKHQ